MSKAIKTALSLLSSKPTANKISSINVRVSPPKKLQTYQQNPEKLYTKTVLTVTFQEEASSSAAATTNKWHPTVPKKSTSALLEYLLQPPSSSPCKKPDVSKKFTTTKFKSKNLKFKPVTEYSDVEEDYGDYTFITKKTIDTACKIIGDSPDHSDIPPENTI